MSNIVETVKNALLAAFTKKNSRFRSIPKDELRSYVFNSNPVAKDALSAETFRKTGADMPVLT